MTAAHSEAARLALCLRPVEGLAQVQEPGRTGDEARSRGRLGPGLAMTEDQRRGLYILLAAAIAGGSIASA